MNTDKKNGINRIERLLMRLPLNTNHLYETETFANWN